MTDMLTFLTATFNEQDEITDLIDSVEPFVDAFAICDDDSKDLTTTILGNYHHQLKKPFSFKIIDHTGLPETVKNEALSLVETEWVLMLDCDERLMSETLAAIRQFVYSEESIAYDYVYFRQLEIIDNVHVRTFQKCKLFRRSVVRFPLNNIHADDQFVGEGIYKDDWVVYHRKSSSKQRLREKEYIETYNKLFSDGHIDEGRRQWLRNLHHYVKEGG